MATNKPTLGARLRTARLEAGLTVRELARLAGMNHSYLVKLETDQKDNPSAEKLQRLAEVLEIDASEMLSYIGVEPASTLPPATMYFRRKYGMNERDAEEIANIVDKFRDERKTRGGDDAKDGSGQTNQH
jgi:transcriptional regulator with XRE-family HTH domain